MDIHTLESIRRIKEASKNGKLVMFVGAGVSALSGYPSWGGLIEKLDLSREKNGYYSDEDYLTIPQKYYNSRGHKEYYDIIKQTFDVELEPNFIHDEILRLKPTHIITTNYDNLIEKAITKKGMFYDVISRDRDVANTKSRNFIIKMHGEIEHENIVLKEEDFINYDNNFKLIETLVKSVIASNLVVFAGYSIKEVNVKKILSWVKELQGESFQPTYWLYIGSPNRDKDKITKEDYDYYKGRGINIIDYNDLKESENKIDNYENRYKLVLDSILNYEKNKEVQGVRGIEHLYNKLLPLNKLNRVRVKDLRDKIGDDYIIDEIGRIDNLSAYSEEDRSTNYIEKFNQLYTKVANNEKIDNNEKYKTIANIFKKGNILAYISREDKENIVYKFDNNLCKSDYYEFNYLDMNESIIKINTDINNDYIKAFNLYKLGRHKESYSLYSNVSIKAFETKNYLLYYLSQINRYWVGMLIKGYKYRYEEEFVNKVMLDIENIDLSSLFNSLPTTFKNDFKTLEDIANFKFVHNNLFNVSNIGKKVDYNRESYVAEFGLTKLNKLLYLINEILEFLNENYIILDDFSEVKLLFTEYTRVILAEYSSKFNKKLVINNTAELFGTQDKINRITIDYTDILIMTRYIENKELKNIFDKFSITILEINDTSKCISIFENVSNYLINMKYIDIYLRQKLKNELENIVFLLRYMRLSTDEYIKIIEVLSVIDESILSMNDKIMFLDKQEVYNQNKDVRIIHKLDEWLYNEFSNYNILKKNNNARYTSIGQYVHVKDSNYISKIDDLANSQINYTDNDELLNIIYLSIVLSEKTIEKLKNKVINKLKEEFSFDLFKSGVMYKVIDKSEIFEDDIYKYIKELEKNRNTSVRVYPDEFKEILESIGIIIFRNELSKDKFKEFIKYSDKLNFLIDPDGFDYSDFKDEWILEYNKVFHEAISKTKAGLKVKKILEKYISSGQSDKEILDLYFEVYQELRFIKPKKRIRRKFIK